LERAELTQRQKDTLDYVRKNPGVIKQQVVDHLARSGISSRRTVYKDLRVLIKDNEMIVVRKDKPNSQIHYLYINRESLLFSTITELDDFKNALFVLLSKTREIHEKLEFEAKKASRDYSIQRKIYELQYIVSSSIFDIYKYFIDTHVLHALFKWPESTKDKEILNKLNTTFFVNMQEIQSKISEAMTIVFRPSHRKEEFIQLMFSKPSTLDVSSFGQMLGTFELVGLDKEFEPIMDHLWKTGFEYIDFERKRKSNSKDWRNALRGHKARFASPLLVLVAKQLLRR
jgi:hypothetical protein